MYKDRHCMNNVDNYPKAGEKHHEYKRDDMMPGMVMPPVYECPTERVCHREIHHEVPHV